MLRFDHFAVGASTLDAGNQWAKRNLGIEVPPGGQHLQMATHNLVTATGADTYLEVIAVDPAGVAPRRPRWFGLDDARIIERLASSPAPLAWVASTMDLEDECRTARELGIDVGRPVAMSRDGLSWRMALTDDGFPALGGAAPLIIEWPPGEHVAGRMVDLGIRIREISIETPHADQLNELLEALNLDDRDSILRVTEAPSAEESNLSVRLERSQEVNCVLSQVQDRVIGHS